jgi:hypothetical protein
MKKKLLSFAAMILLALFFVSCAEDTPYGKWHSTDPDLTLDIGPFFDSLYFGIYIDEGEKVDVLAFVNGIGGSSFMLGIYSYDEYDFSKQDWNYIGGKRYGNNIPPPKYFDGEWKLKGNKLYYTLYESYQEETGYETIIFELIEEYDPSDRKDVIHTKPYEESIRIPYGQWSSTEPYMRLDIDPGIDGTVFGGEYLTEGASAPSGIYAMLFSRYGRIEMEIRNLEDRDSDGFVRYFIGYIREEDGRLIYDLADKGAGYGQPTGESIVFEKTGEYEIPPPPQTEYAHPGEVWRCADPDITINVDPEADENGYHRLGVYEKDGESIDIVARYNEDGRVFSIFDGRDYTFADGDWRLVGHNPLFTGTFVIDGDELRFVQIPPWRKLNGYDEMVFQRVSLTNEEAVADE